MAYKHNFYSWDEGILVDHWFTSPSFCPVVVHYDMFWGLQLGYHLYHDNVIKWKHFPHYWPFVRGIYRSPQRPMTQSFDVFFDQRPIKRLSKQSWGWWFETHSPPLWRHSNAKQMLLPQLPLSTHIYDILRHSQDCWNIYLTWLQANVCTSFLIIKPKQSWNVYCTLL